MGAFARPLEEVLKNLTYDGCHGLTYIKNFARDTADFLHKALRFLSSLSNLGNSSWWLSRLNPGDGIHDMAWVITHQCLQTTC